MQTLLFIIGFLVFNFAVCILDVNAQSRSGTYNRKDKWGSGRLVITSGKSFFSFKLNVGRTGKTLFEYCVGEMKGRAKWIAKNIAEYNGDFNERDADGEAIGCRLTFVFTGNTITIREGDCNDFHGAMCNFEGKYSRPARTKPKNSPRKLPRIVITV
jgi:hypothetical protein